MDKLYGNLMKVCRCHRRDLTDGQLDSFGNILVCYHGRKKLTLLEIEKVHVPRCCGRPRAAVLSQHVCQQPGSQHRGALLCHEHAVQHSRCCPRPTRARLTAAETSLIADLITFFETHLDYDKLVAWGRCPPLMRRRVESETGLRSKDSLLSYANMYSDVRESVDYVHYEAGQPRRRPAHTRRRAR